MLNLLFGLAVVAFGQTGSKSVPYDFVNSTYLLSAATGYMIHRTTEPIHESSIASATDIYVATATLTQRGGRYVHVWAHGTISNAAGGSRDYTYYIQRDVSGVTTKLTGDYVQTCSGTSTEYIAIDAHTNSSTAGAVSYALVMKSSNATGTQTLRHSHVIVQEF